MLTVVYGAMLDTSDPQQIEDSDADLDAKATLTKDGTLQSLEGGQTKRMDTNIQSVLEVDSDDMLHNSKSKIDSSGKKSRSNKVDKHADDSKKLQTKADADSAITKERETEDQDWGSDLILESMGVELLAVLCLIFVLVCVWVMVCYFRGERIKNMIWSKAPCSKNAILPSAQKHVVTATDLRDVFSVIPSDVEIWKEVLEKEKESGQGLRWIVLRWNMDMKTLTFVLIL